MDKMRKKMSTEKEVEEDMEVTEVNNPKEDKMKTNGSETKLNNVQTELDWDGAKVNKLTGAKRGKAKLPGEIVAELNHLSGPGGGVVKPNSGDSNFTPQNIRITGKDYFSMPKITVFRSAKQPKPNLVPALPAENIGGGDCSGGAPTPAAPAGKVSRGGAGHVQQVDHQEEENRQTDLHHVMTDKCQGARSCACVRARNCAQTPLDNDRTLNGTAQQCTCLENDVHAQGVTDPELDIIPNLAVQQCACTNCVHVQGTDQVQDSDTITNNLTLPTEGHSSEKVRTGPAHSKVLAMVRMVEDKIREGEDNRIIKKAGRRKKVRGLKPSVQQKITALFGNFEKRGR